MNHDNFLLALAIVLVFISLVGFGISYFSAIGFRGRISGFDIADSVGNINLSIEDIAAINFTTQVLDFGSGRVTPGEASATINTAWNNESNITDGNWTADGTDGGLVVENIGNVNISLNITTGTDAAGLIGGTSPTYQYNISELDTNACTNFTANTTIEVGLFYDASTTHAQICDPFEFTDDTDRIRIDVNLVIPQDSKTGAIGDVITLTFWQDADDP